MWKGKMAILPAYNLAFPNILYETKETRVKKLLEKLEKQNIIRGL